VTRQPEIGGCLVKSAEVRFCVPGNAAQKRQHRSNFSDYRSDTARPLSQNFVAMITTVSSPGLGAAMIGF
jgi:hypothetical protein